MKSFFRIFFVIAVLATSLLFSMGQQSAEYDRDFRIAAELASKKGHVKDGYIDAGYVDWFCKIIKIVKEEDQNFKKLIDEYRSLLVDYRIVILKYDPRVENNVKEFLKKYTGKEEISNNLQGRWHSAVSFRDPLIDIPTVMQLCNTITGAEMYQHKKLPHQERFSTDHTIEFHEINKGKDVEWSFVLAKFYYAYNNISSKKEHTITYDPINKIVKSNV